MAPMRVVSWLRAATLAFPTSRSVAQWSARVVPVTVAGPRRRFTGFRGPYQQISLVRES